MFEKGETPVEHDADEGQMDQIFQNFILHLPTVGRQAIGELLEQTILEYGLRHFAYVSFPSGEDDVPLMLTFNFLNAGTNFSLMGKPCANATECSDQFWEHHTFIYYGLLQQQGVV